MLKENKTYYDDFANVYEVHRHEGYHKLIDELEMEALLPYIDGQDVLEAGCGTGLILERVAHMAKRAVGVDLSPGMLEVAKEKGLDVQVSDLGSLPFEDNSFDTIYSFKVLAHVEAIKEAMEEMARVTRPGGHLVLEFYNPFSLRGLVKKLKPATTITSDTNDEQVYTRFDTLADVKSYLPNSLRFIDTRGVRVVTPFAGLHKIPVVKQIFGALEHGLLASPFRGLGGFLVVILQKK